MYYLSISSAFHDKEGKNCFDLHCINLKDLVTGYAGYGECMEADAELSQAWNT